MKSTFKMSILALSLGLMTAVTSCKEEPKEVKNDVDSTTTIEVKAPDSTQTPMPDSSTTTSTTTTVEVKKDEKAK
jgi:hypothetical protein